MTEYASNKTPFSLTEVDIDSPGGVPAKDVGYHDLNGLERMMKNLASDTGAGELFMSFSSQFLR